MTRDEIIRMALEAGFLKHADALYTNHRFGDCIGELERFAALVAAAEREACARVCDATPPYPFRPSIEAAHAIRARKDKQ